MTVPREARRDAKEYARAQMFYGEGAGTRRKLIAATVEGKAHRSPAYAKEFRKELSRQDMAEHAAKARHERERTDRNAAVTRNVRGVLTGNYQSVSTGLVVLSVVGYYAHLTGLDKKAVVKGKEVLANYRAWRLKRKIEQSLLNDVNNPQG